ncbi:HU family DNA-binding protein [Salipiger sp. IMCC34102]|uniref:HU family DNA-binding protein n=1 Tax=Salipiger sp. IMCC34102 TaxID=2510647 RepID=UPI001F5DADCD|nr:HU family DNA-binding protein [Salipiger sp. IMCC34102]
MADTPKTPQSTLTLKPNPAKARVEDATPHAVPTPRVVGGHAQVSDGEAMKKKEFIDRVLARCGVKKRDAKPAIEATMAELADLLAAGGDLNLPPMGKLKSVKSRDLGNGAKVMTLKLRTMKDGAGPDTGKTGVAEDGEDG